MIGVVPIERAQEVARENELDLVEVSPNAEPPVCKVLDYGKFKYEQKKREHEAKRKQSGGDMKEVRFRPKTDTHDRQIKIARARRFLQEGHRVQVTLLFRGREMQHARELTDSVLNEVASELGDIAKIERAINREGKRAFMSLMPKVVSKAKNKTKSSKRDKGKGSKKAKKVANEEVKEPIINKEIAEALKDVKVKEEVNKEAQVAEKEEVPEDVPEETSEE